ncbi:MAG: hypothetical protein MMC23_003839 [Stictis urceolatum]|nr:hypothetical protein [Stictis urceolata]
MDETTFREKLAVNSQQGGTGSLGGSDPSQADTFRCHRGRLEALLGNGLSINWDKRLKEVQLPVQSKELTALFDDGSSLRPVCLIGCDGPHSMTRSSLTSAMKLEVLPYVVFNGKRRIPRTEYADTMHKYMQDSVLIETRKGDIRLEISINEFAGSHVDLSYVYSRPAKQNGDPLHKPDRPVPGATDIPEELYEELDALQDLEAPFKDVFDSEKVRDDRLLHWLMRTMEPDGNEAKRLADSGVVLIGDAVHAEPILGGEGANIAINDGIDLAEHIAAYGVGSFEWFSKSKYNTWKTSVENSKKQISEIHAVKTSHL